MLKQCTKCGEWKEETEFSWKSKSEGKRHSQCKECRRQKDRAYYKQNPERKNKIRSRSKEHRKNIKDFILNYKKQCSCAICGDSRWYVLDFHHVDQSTKIKTITDMVHTDTSLKILKLELEKCIPVCANCHREIHYKLGYIKDQGEQLNGRAEA